MNKGYKTHDTRHKYIELGCYWFFTCVLCRVSLIMKFTKHYIVIALIILACIISYANSIQNSFVWDDYSLIEYNPYIKDFTHLKEIFTKQLYEGSGQYTNFYRPLQSITVAIDYKIWGMNPAGYHITNVILHTSAAMLLYILLFLISKSIFAGAIAALLFSVHPLNVSAVTYISGRADLLGALFIYASFILYIFYTKREKNISLYAFSIVFYILAILSKEAFVIYPVIYLLYSQIFSVQKNQNKIKLFVPYVITALIYIILRATIFNFNTPEVGSLAPVSWDMRIATAFKVVFLYFKLFLMPFPLYMERQVRIVSFKDIYGLCALGGIVLIFYLMYKMYRKKDKQLFFSSAYYFINILPVSSILVPLNTFMAEHWLYTASGLGVFMAAGIFLDRLSGINKYVKYVIILMLVLVLAWFSFLTIRRNQDWRDSLVFWTNTVKYAPDSYKANVELGTAYSQKGDYLNAEIYFKKALGLNPDHYSAYNNLGNVYNFTGDFKKAEQFYLKSIEINPKNANAYNNLGNIYIKMNRYDDAIDYCKKAIGLNIHNAKYYMNLGRAYYEKGMFMEAKDSFTKALQVDPYHKGAQEFLR